MLIYFISKKNKNNDNSKKETFINKLIEIYFNNCKDIFDYINEKKLMKKFIIKSNISKLEIYNFFYNIFTSKQRESLNIENIEKLYKEKYGIKNTSNIENSSSGIKTRANSSISSEIKFEFNNHKEEKHISSEKVSKKLNKENIIVGFNHDNKNKKNLEIKMDINEIIQMNEKELIKENDIEINKNINVNFEEMKKFDLKLIIKNKDIPIVHYNKIIKDKQSDLIKLFANPKTNFFWKTFIFSLKDMIFNNKNFIKASKSFKMFSRDSILEKSSPEEDNLYLNYPTKVKNFICNDYYRPFLKPDTKFFERDMLKITHNYIPQKIFEKIKNKNSFNKISFIKYFPINFEKDESQGIICENISYRGSILGKIYLKKYFFAFISDYTTNQNILDKSQRDPLFFIYSFQDISKHVNVKLKTIFIYYRDIQEIIIRRFFLKRIGYEIFLKDGRSYLFNFYNLENFNKFKSLIEKKEVYIINDPVKVFEKKEYKNKFKKGEISNFQYLLLINKFSSRTYNDINQYVIFPLLYIDLKNNKKRDLSKVVCLNKEGKYSQMNKYKDNYKIQGYYFNNHYSSSAYTLYYLIRLIPYTHLLIDFQSFKFDNPERMFSNYNRFSSGIMGSSENRELIPELFHNYEICLNLNYNNIGKFNFSNVLINNFVSNKYKTSIEFIINNRKSLEQTNIVPWINNIFGYNQINISKGVMNLFPTSSYEQLFDDEIPKIIEKNKDKSDFEIYKIIRIKLAVLDIGITPIQMFKSSHPEKNLGNNNHINIEGRTNSINLKNSDFNINTDIKSVINNNSQKEKKLNDKEKKVKDSFSSIEKFIKTQNSSQYKLSINNETMNLFFIYKNKIIIHNIFKTTKSDPFKKIKYPIVLNLSNNLISLELNFFDSSRNIICELMPGFYCICRNENKTLKFISNYNNECNISFLWVNIITAIESLNSTIITTNLGSNYICKIFFGDEEGFLGLIEFKYEYIFKSNEIKFKTINILQKIKIHENCINVIFHKEKLNIILSSSLNGDIAINNAYSLEILNIIKIGTKYLINDIKISLYDLLYVRCYNYQNKNYYLKCFTLNGLKVTKLKSKTKITNFLINNYINVFYENKCVDIFCLYDLKNLIRTYNAKDNLTEKRNDKEENQKAKIESYKIIHCLYCIKITTIIDIYDNNCLQLENFDLI